MPAPLIYTSAGQVSAVVPYGVGGRRTTDLQIEYNGRLSGSVTLDVVSASPGIFTIDASGRGQGAILNHDYQVNGASNPAARGSVVVVYATGGGQTNPTGEDGRIISSAAAQAQNVTAQIAGIAAEVLYAGPAPGLVSGVLQVNLRIPDSTPGGMQPIRIAIGAATSQAGAS